MLKPLILLILTYTAVRDASAETCKMDEELQDRGGTSKCYCKPEYAVASLEELKPDLACNLYDMTATFHKCHVNDLGIYYNKTHFKDYVYYKFRDDDVTNSFIVEAPLDLIHSGGMTYTTDGTHVTYTTRFIIDFNDPDDPVIRENPLDVTLQCVYPLNMISSLNIALKPFLRSIIIVVPGEGEFETFMALYKDKSYTTPYTDLELKLPLKELLYVGVFFLGGSSNLVLVMKDCYATPTKDRNDPVKYSILKNGCPNGAYGAVTVLENGKSKQGQFSVQLIKFAAEDEVYLHCDVKLCDTKTETCAPPCSRVGSRSDISESLDSTGSFTIGPIKRSGASSSSPVTGPHIFWTLLIPALTFLKQSL